MAAYTYPGVYIEEISSGQHTITGVATSIAAFIGWTNMGPVGEAVMVESWSQYESLFGGMIPGIYLGYAVYQFFLNGGSQAYIVRLCDTTQAKAAVATIGGLVVTANSPGAWGNNIAIAISNVNSVNSTFNLQVFELSASGTLSLVESYTNLSTSSSSGEYAVSVVNNDSEFIQLTAPISLPTATASQSKVYSIPGSVTNSGFTAGETVTQATSGVTGTLLAVPGTSGPMVLSNLSGIADATHTWDAGAAVFTPTATPSQLPLALVSGSVTTGAFTPGETVTQPQSGGSTASAVLVGVTTGTVPGLATQGLMLLAGVSGAMANSFNTWTDSGGAVFTPSSAPMSTSAIPLALGASSTKGADDPQLVPGAAGGAFETQLLNTQATPPTPPITGYPLLANIPIFNLLCVPGECTVAAVSALQAFCAQYRAFLIVDSDVNAVVGTGSNGLSKTGPADIGGDSFVNQYAGNSAFYFPWVQAPDPMAGFRPANFPPCGFVAGIYASTDASRGVWKAPAGIEESLTGALGLQYVLNDLQNGSLNTLGVNCLRQFPNFGEVVWGARTIAGSDALGSQWKYIPIRRLALFLESSLYAGTQWAVFEPNAEPLWGQVRLSIGTFLQGLFLKGAFAGTTPQQAYFVKCDADNNPPPSTALGILNITVGFAPLYPAEFVVIQIQQMMNQS